MIKCGPVPPALRQTGIRGIYSVLNSLGRDTVVMRSPRPQGVRANDKVDIVGLVIIQAVVLLVMDTKTSVDQLR